MDLNTAFGQCQIMSGLVDELEACEIDLGPIREGIAGCWKGDNADFFIKKLDESIRTAGNLKGNVQSMYYTMVRAYNEAVEEGTDGE